MKIQKIYKKYKIARNLQGHQLRVAAVASLICDNYKKKTDKETITTACLLHDMGNILKSNFDIIPESFEPEGRKYWEEIKQEFSNKYGYNAEKATEKITKEIGVNKKVQKLIDNFRFPDSYNSEFDIQRLIGVYSDLRVAPQGVVSLKKRLEDSKIRYVEIEKNFTEHEFDKMTKSRFIAEKILLKDLTINPTDITEESVKNIYNDLKSYNIELNGE